jgi:hypothetical protein
MTITELNNEYITQLKKKYYEATGNNQSDTEYLHKWIMDRSQVYDLCALELKRIRDDDNRVKKLLNITAEVGNVGIYNNLATHLGGPIITISPFGFTIKESMTLNGKLVYNNNQVLIEPDGIINSKVPKISMFDTFITHDPNLSEDDNMLNALVERAWGKDSIAISVLGFTGDKDRKQKLDDLEQLKNRILSAKEEERVGNVRLPIVTTYESEEAEGYGMYIKTIVTDQYQLVNAINEKMMVKELPSAIREKMQTREDKRIGGGRRR